MALYDLGTAILALSALFGIFSFLQASDTTLIPLDQLTVEEAYLEVQLIKRQLSSANPPNMTAEQKAILDKMFNTDLGALKPNDPLPYVCRQQLSKFRQAFTNWDQPLKPGTIEYMLTRALGQGYLYQAMINYVYRSVTRGHKDYPEAVSRAKKAVDELCIVHKEVKEKNDNSSSLVKPEDVRKLEVAIETARDAVMAMPRVDENGEPVPGTTSPSMQSTSSGILPEESQDEPDVGGSLPAGVLMIPGSSLKQATSSALLLPDKSPDEPDGPVESSSEFSSAEQVKDSAMGGEDSVGPDAVSSDGPPGGNPIQPDGQLPSGSASSLPGGWSSSPPRKSRYKLFPLLKQPYVWGSALVLAAGAGYYFLKSHPASSSGDLYSMSTSTLNFATVASEGSSLFWYIILPLGGLVALIALGYWCWYCIKTRGTPPEEEAKAATEISKRASQKSQQLASTTTTGTSSSAGTTST